MHLFTDSALGQLTLLVVGYAGLVVLAALGVAISRIPRPAPLDQAVWILEGLLVLRLVAGVGSMLGGQQAAEPAAYVGYLVSSICVLPIAMRAVSDDRGPWSSAVITVAALAVVVIAVRLQMTWA